MDQIKNILAHKDILRAIARCKTKYRKSLLIKSDKELINAICSCVYNVLLGNVKISEEDKKNLVKYKSVLRKLVEKSTLKGKKKLLIQQGGFLQFIIPAVITGLASIISSAINSSNSEE